MNRPGYGALAALIGASAVSTFGNQITALAIPWFVLTTTGSATRTGLVGVATFLPMAIASFLGGAVVDRLGPKRTSVLGDLLSGTTVALVPLLSGAGLLSFGMLLVLVFLGVLLDMPGVTARQALLPDVAVHAGVRLERANGIFHSVANAAGLAGPLLAGVLIAWLGASRVLWLDAASFFVSAALIARALPARSAVAEPASRTYWGDVAAGLGVLRRDRLLRSIVIAGVVANMLAAPLWAVVVPVYAKAVYDSPVALGLLMASVGTGLLVGSLLFSAVGHRWPRRAVLCGGTLITALPLLILTALPALPVAMASMVVVGVASGPLSPLVFTILQERVPAEMRGRVIGAVLGVLASSTPVGVAAAGPVLEMAGLRLTLVVITVGFVVNAVGIAMAPVFRSGLGVEDEPGMREA